MVLWILIILLVLLALLVVLGYALARYSIRIPRQSLEEARAWQEDHYDLSWYDPLDKANYTVESYDGYVLHAQLLHNPDAGADQSGRYMLLSHGYTDNRYGSLKYTKMYLDLGFRVIVYDLRGHGANEETYCTYSIRERRDLNAMIEDTHARYPDLKTLGIHGESLGSATSIAVLEYKPPADFVVADCGFSEITTVMREGLRSFHLPGALVYLASQFAKPMCGHFYREMCPIDSLKDNRIPILFLHGAEDDFILPSHGRAMQKATAGYSEMYEIPGAGHAASVLTDPEAYRSYVEGFLQRIGVFAKPGDEPESGQLREPEAEPGAGA